MGIPSDRQFLGLVERILPGWFPHLPCQSQYNRRLRSLVSPPSGSRSRASSRTSKGQMRLERHVAKTPAGLAVRIAQRLLALTLGMLLNTLSGRPARAVVAYDGR